MVDFMGRKHAIEARLAPQREAAKRRRDAWQADTVQALLDQGLLVDAATGL